MKSDEMAKDYAERAKWVLHETEQALAASNGPVCVRRCQEALELSAKAALRKLGIEYPREHDVGDALQAARNEMPRELNAKLKGIENLLSELADIRGPAYYGYETQGRPASETFTKEYAEQTLSNVKPAVTLLLNFVTQT